MELEMENRRVCDESSLADEFNDFSLRLWNNKERTITLVTLSLMTQNWRNLFHPGLAPLLVVSYLKLNRRRLLISLVRSRSTRQLDMMVWVPKFSNLSHHDLSTYFAGYWTYELQQIPSLINGKLAKLHQTAQRRSVTWKK